MQKQHIVGFFEQGQEFCLLGDGEAWLWHKLGDLDGWHCDHRPVSLYIIHTSEGKQQAARRHLAHCEVYQARLYVFAHGGAVALQEDDGADPDAPPEALPTETDEERDARWKADKEALWGPDPAPRLPPQRPDFSLVAYRPWDAVGDLVAILEAGGVPAIRKGQEDEVRSLLGARFVGGNYGDVRELLTAVFKTEQIRLVHAQAALAWLNAKEPLVGRAAIRAAINGILSGAALRQAQDGETAEVTAPTEAEEDGPE